MAILLILTVFVTAQDLSNLEEDLEERINQLENAKENIEDLSCEQTKEYLKQEWVKILKDKPIGKLIVGIDNFLKNFSPIFEIFLGVDELKRKVIDSLTENNVDDIFNETQNEIDIAFDRLREKLFALDKTIADTSKKYRGKISNALIELKGKADQAQNRKFEVTLRQLDRACTIIFPSENLQEREINFIYFVNKYGEGFLKKIFDELEIDKFEHQVIEL